MTKKAASDAIQRIGTPQPEQALRTQVIDERQPGRILRDFQIMLDFIGGEGLEAGGKHRLPAMNRLAELNARLTRPYQVALQRPQLRSFPNLQGMYLLLRATGLGVIQGSGKSARIMINQDLLQAWNALNPTERYFNLLEAWLLRGSGEMIGESEHGMFDSALTTFMWNWDSIDQRGRSISEPTSNDRDLLLRHAYHVALMDLFGLVEIQSGKPARGGNWWPRHVRRTAFGEALMETILTPRMGAAGANAGGPLDLFSIVDALLLDAPEDEDDQTEDDDEEAEIDEDEDVNLVSEGGEPLDHDEASLAPAPFGELQGALKPFFPEWEKNLPVPQQEFRDGLWVFEVSLDRARRTIAMPADHTPDDLAEWILRAFNFDPDRLYEFSIPDPSGLTVRLPHPDCASGMSTASVRIGMLPLRQGETMSFLYDFGDYWEFDVKLERIEPRDPSNKKRLKPAILAKSGKASPQFRDSWF